MYKLFLEQETLTIDQNQSQSSQNYEKSPSVGLHAQFKLKNHPKQKRDLNSSEPPFQTPTENKDAKHKNPLGNVENDKSLIRKQAKIILKEMEETVDLLLEKVQLNFFQGDSMDVYVLEENSIEEYLRNGVVFKMKNQVYYCLHVMELQPLIRYFLQKLYQQTPKLILQDVVRAVFITIFFFQLQIMYQQKSKNSQEFAEKALAYLSYLPSGSFNILDPKNLAEPFKKNEAQVRPQILSLNNILLRSIFDILNIIMGNRSSSQNSKTYIASDEDESKTNEKNPVKMGKRIKKQRKQRKYQK